LEALRWEMDRVEEEGYFSLGEELSTLFVGGGTPSFMDAEAMAGLVQVLGRRRLQHPDLEWTVEANPESFTEETARGWARVGVNRVSLGVQSFQEAPLRWLHRLHGPDEPGRAVERARGVGINNLSLDLIFGLPKEVPRDWGKELDSALATGVPHLSLYGLTVEKDTPLGKAVAAGSVCLPDEEGHREQFLEAHERLTSEGYHHYEVSNYSLPGYEARHNRVYWDLVPYLGLGNSAHSFCFPRRRWNVRDWVEYRRAAREGGSPWAAEENLTSRDRRLEILWLGLRTDRGILAEGLGQEARSLVQRWASKGQALIEGGVVRLTPLGWLLLDDLVVQLDLALEG
jgi:oxygen-independent coproporphyrinogen-3 oxidase